MDALALLIGLCASQAVIIGLAQHYNLAVFQQIQPITAGLIPVAAWLVFCYVALRPLKRSDILHCAGPVCVLWSLLLFPALLDALIPLLFLAYGVAIIFVCRRGADSLPQARIEGGNLPSLIWQLISVSLIVSSVIELIIAVAFETGYIWLPPILISMVFAVNLSLIGLLSVRHELTGKGPEPDSNKSINKATVCKVMSRLDTLMKNERPYLDPDLTLIKLARKTGIPAKTLSAVINQSTGQSVSRLVNEARIRAVQDALIAGQTVTVAMLSSGFYTKSNFHREFLRITGMSPTQWLQSQPPVSTSPPSPE